MFVWQLLHKKLKCSFESSNKYMYSHDFYVLIFDSITLHQTLRTPELHHKDFEIIRRSHNDPHYIY